MSVNTPCFRGSGVDGRRNPIYCVSMNPSDRLPTLRPLTSGELKVIALLDKGLKYQVVADQLGIGRNGVVWRTRNAAAKIPGTLEMRAKCIAWWRGATKKGLGAE